MTFRPTTCRSRRDSGGVRRGKFIKVVGGEPSRDAAAVAAIPGGVRRAALVLMFAPMSRRSRRDSGGREADRSECRGKAHNGLIMRRSRRDSGGREAGTDSFTPLKTNTNHPALFDQPQSPRDSGGREGGP